MDYHLGEALLGGRTPILALHGAGGAASVWQAQRRRVGVEFPFIAVDLPGHAQSPGPSRDTVEAYLGDVLELLDELKIERALWLGHSMGGAISQLAALEHPERVAGLILVATSARLGVAEAILTTLEQDREQFQMLFERFTFGPQAGRPIIDQAAEVLRSTPTAVLLDDFRACDRFDVRKRVAEIAAPCLVISAEHDLLTPAEYGRKLAAAVSGARFELIPGCGHMLPLEAWREVSDLIAGFAGEFA